MKKDNNFYLFLTMISFIACFIVSFLILDKSIVLGPIKTSASIIIYPLTFALATLFCERYGKAKTFNLFVYAVFSLIFTSIMLFITSLFPAYGESIIKVNYRLMFSFITSFVLSNFLNLAIYYYLDKKRKINFLISSVIAITFDSLVFSLLAFLGELNIKDIFTIFANKYVVSVAFMIIYALIFAYIIPTVINTKPVEIKKIKKEEIKKPTPKKKETKIKTKKEQ